MAIRVAAIVVVAAVAVAAAAAVVSLEQMFADSLNLFSQCHEAFFSRRGNLILQKCRRWL